MGSQSERPSAARQRITTPSLRPENSSPVADEQGISLGVQGAEKLPPKKERAIEHARIEISIVFDQVMKELESETRDLPDNPYSNRCVARRLGVAATTVCKWRAYRGGKGDKPLPLGALHLLPFAIRRRMLAHIERLATT